MKAKHTSGPWEHFPTGLCFAIIPSGFTKAPRIAEVLHDETDFGVNSGYDEAEANAKLIAAAPELLLLITAFSNVNVFSPKDVAELTVEADKLIQKASP